MENSYSVEKIHENYKNFYELKKIWRLEKMNIHNDIGENIKFLAKSEIWIIPT